MSDVDPVFQGLLRPAMVAGVSHSWLVVELLLPLILFLGTKSFWPVLLLPVLHVVGMLGIAYDKRFVEVEAARAQCHGPLRRVFGRNVYLP